MVVTQTTNGLFPTISERQRHHLQTGTYILSSVSHTLLLLSFSFPTNTLLFDIGMLMGEREGKESADSDIRDNGGGEEKRKTLRNQVGPRFYRGSLQSGPVNPGPDNPETVKPGELLVADYLTPPFFWVGTRSGLTGPDCM
jgi:hypothetical protein